MPPFLAKDLCLSLDQLHKFMLIWLVLEQDPRDHQPQPGLQALAFGSVQKQVWQRFAACWWAILRACTGQCVISKFDALLHRSSIGKGAHSRYKLYVGLMVTSTCFGDGSQSRQTLPEFDSAQHCYLSWSRRPFCLAFRLGALGRKYLSFAVTVWLHSAADSGHPGRPFCSDCRPSGYACGRPL